MLFFAPQALKQFLRLLMGEGGELRENQADSKKNRKKRLARKLRQKKGLMLGSARLETLAETLHEFPEPSPEGTHPLRGYDPTATASPPIERRRDPMRLAPTPAPVAAFTQSEDSMVLELHTRGDTLVNTFAAEVTDLDNQIHAALHSPDGAAAAFDMTQEANRLVSGSHEEINRLMTRVEEIERLTVSAEAAAQQQAPSPWWVSQMRRQAKPATAGPQPQSPADRSAMAARAHRQAIGSLAPVSTPSPRLQNVAARQKLTDLARGHFRPKVAAATTASVALRNNLPSRPSLFARIANFRSKVEDVREEISHAEHHFQDELKTLAKTQAQAKPERRRGPRLSNELGAPKPKPPTDPTKQG